MKEIYLSSGKAVKIDNITSEDIDIEVIANSLSNICRYGGHIETFYSVAEHSILLAEYFQRKSKIEEAKLALLHDAAEAFISDIPAPLKGSFMYFQGEGWTGPIIPIAKLEEEILNKIFVKFSVDPSLWMASGVPLADLRIRINELCIRPDEARKVYQGEKPLKGVKLHCWLPSVAKVAFLEKFRELF